MKIRILNNVTPILHKMGHGLYHEYLDYERIYPFEVFTSQYLPKIGFSFSINDYYLEAKVRNNEDN